MFFSSNKKGFTLLELIIASFVFITGVLGTFLIAQHFIFNTQTSISRLTASFLAQEGIEIVRNLRDENWLNNRDWDQGIADGIWQSSYNDPSLEALENDGRIYLDANNLFSHDNSGSSTKFKRKITISDDDPEFLEVVVWMGWEERGDSYQLEVRENLYPWWSY